MNTTLACLAMAAALSAPFSASAQTPDALTAKALVDGCEALIAIDAGQSEPSGWDQQRVLESLVGSGICTGYIKGFLGGASFASYQAEGPNVDKFCVPRGVTIPQIARVLSSRLKEKPEFEHVEAYPFVIGILISTWPCQKSATGDSNG